MKFKYQARTKEGKPRSGFIEASSRESALDILQRYGLYVTFLENVEKEPIFLKKVSFFERVKEKDLIIFMRQLAIMLKAGVTPVEALNTIALQTENSSFREKILKIADEVEGGTFLSKAFALFPEIFPRYFIAVLKSGEMSAELSQALDYLADYIEDQHYIKSKIRGALVYPAFVVFLFLIVFVFLMIFIVPNIASVLLQTGKELPWVTQAILSISAFLQKWLVFLISGVIIFFILLYKYLQTKEGKELTDRLILRLPILGPFFIKVYINRMVQNLSTLIKSGVPIIQALEVTEEVVGNSYYQQIVRDLRKNVSKGKQMSQVLIGYPDVIPPLVSQMINIGEKAGTIDQELDYIKEFYRKEIEVSIDKFLSMIEPIMILGLGLMVSFLAVAVLMPIYQTMSF